MSVVTAYVEPPDGRPFTVDDLAEMPDDGHRYELLDGTLVVTPAPGWAHQEAAGSLYVILRDRCPRDFRAVIAPFAVRLADDTELEPDVIVARYADLDRKRLSKPPVLAAEVCSPSTSIFDHNLKKAAYERFGVPSYWVIDPHESKPIVTVFELADGSYVEVARATGDEWLTVERPFPVEFAPIDLTAGLRP